MRSEKQSEDFAQAADTFADLLLADGGIAEHERASRRARSVFAGTPEVIAGNAIDANASQGRLFDHGSLRDPLGRPKDDVSAGARAGDLHAVAQVFLHSIE